MALAGLGVEARDGLPLALRLVFSATLLTEAGILVYILIARFPVEFHMFFAIMVLFAAVTYMLQFSVKHDARLEAVLRKLKMRTGLGENLKLVWAPGGSDSLVGEVRGDCIYIYAKNFEEAYETLLEEFIEYAVAEASKPYITILNAVIKAVNEEAYRRRDKVAKGLAKLLKSTFLRRAERRRRRGVNC